MTNTETTAATWVAHLAGHPEVHFGPRLKTHFEAGRITRLCTCGCNSFDLLIPATVRLEPLGEPGAPGKVFEIAFASNADAEVTFLIFVDSRGYLSGIDVTCGAANHTTVPDDISLGQMLRIGNWYPAGPGATVRTWTGAGVLGPFLGVVVGVGAMQLPVSSVFQSVAAVFVALLLSEGSMWFLLLRYPGLIGDAGVGYFGWGPDNLLYLGALLALGAVLHVALGVLDITPPWVVEHRALVLGTAAGLYGAVSVARTLHLLSKVVEAEHRRHLALSR